MLFGGEFRLESYSVEKQVSSLYLELKFEETNTSEEDLEDVEIKVNALIKFYKNLNNHLFAEVVIIESNVSQHYETTVLSYIENIIKLNNWSHEPTRKLGYKDLFVTVNIDFYLELTIFILSCKSKLIQ